MKPKKNTQNNFLNKRSFISLIVLCSLFYSSCSKFIEVPPPGNQVVSSVVFTDDKSATSTVLGLYSQLTSSLRYFTSGAITLYCGLSADELAYNSTSTDITPFQSNTLASNNYIVQNAIWRYAYIFIYQSNACLEGLNKSTSLTPSVKQQLTGEVKFIRALSYFYLTNLFGDVPLVVTTNYTENQSLPRSSTANVYKLINEDLADAYNLLYSTYPSSGKLRINKWAAAALQARVYLYQNDYVNAELKSSEVINSGTYTLATNLNNVFIASSTEAIWQLMMGSTTSNTPEATTFIPTSTTTRPTYSVTASLLSAFETNDQRKSAWLKSNTVSSVAYYYPYKYKVRAYAANSEYTAVLRLAELYLIRAEARVQQNNISNAVKDLNVIRLRAGLGNVSESIGRSDALVAINHENQIEFFVEWGHRWLDLKRTGQINTVLSPIKPLWKPYQALYPVPLTEIQSNPFLTQNDGYN